MDVSLSQVDTAFKTLKFTSRKAEDVIENGGERELSRLARTSSDMLEKIYELKVVIIESKIAAKEEDEAISKWSDEVDNTAAAYEDLLTRIKTRLGQMQAEEREMALEHDLAEEKKRLELLGVQRTSSQNISGGDEVFVKPGYQRVKLPKLEITKFNGTHIDWYRFWSQFGAEIEDASIAEVTKFSYLKELVVPSVRVLIDGLPFDSEGYANAKDILKQKYGQKSEVANSHIQEIMNLPIIQSSNPSQVHAFYQKIVAHVQALETMGHLSGINGYVRNTLDRLPKIRSDLVRLDVHWREWKFPELVEALREWTERNPVVEAELKDTAKDQNKRLKNFKIRQTTHVMTCVYCDGEHKPTDCTKVTDKVERRKVLSSKRLCFNCARGEHRAFKCPSRGCFKCGSKHHTSLCEKPESNAEEARQEQAQQPQQPQQQPQPETLMCSLNQHSVTFPVVVVCVNGVKCRALLDSGSGSCYASRKLIDVIGCKPFRRQTRSIEMLMRVVKSKVTIYKVNVASVDGSFQLEAEVTKVEKEVLLSLPNPRYEEMLKRYSHLRGITMEDTDTKAELPVHMILGTGFNSNIKMEEIPKIGQPGEPIAEKTRLGWVIQSPGREVEAKSFLSNSSVEDYDQLVRLDILGLEDRPERDQEMVYKEFKEQLGRSEEGWYETSLIWKADHTTLENNEKNSERRLSSLLNGLQKDEKKFEEYDDTIRKQIEVGIVEVAPEVPSEKEFYGPHRAVIKEDAESTKMRVVNDYSAKPNSKCPSLNECLESGPPLQNMLRDIVVRNRMLPIALNCDMKKAFLQIRVREADRDALRFHWIEDRESLKIIALRFTRPPFGLVQSPFILRATTEVHLENSREEFPDTVEEVKDNIYADDVVDGGFEIGQVEVFREELIEIFRRAGFELHKWHSNIATLEGNYEDKAMSGNEETGILGIHWNKKSDEISVKIPEDGDGVTKRKILKYLASIFDPLGLCSPVLLTGKVIFREVCDLKIGWDKIVPKDIKEKWEKWKARLPSSFTVPRSITSYQAPINYIDLHAFGDASKLGCCAVIYAVVFQEGGHSQGLLVSNSRLSKKTLTIPRLELVAAHMAANSLDNVRRALSRYKINRAVCWSDSTTALHWIRGGGKYKEFVKNRVEKILSKMEINWRYVKGEENPADVGSRGCYGDKLEELWWKGPGWLADYDKWPEDILTKGSDETEAEAVLIKEVLKTSIVKDDPMEKLLEKFRYWKVLRITAWIRRFALNSRKNKMKLKGPLTTRELDESLNIWIKKTQASELNEKFISEKERLNLLQDEEGIYRCYGRIQGLTPIYLPKGEFSEKLVKGAHLRTLHGGVGLTMVEVRDKYWISRLRQLVKKIISKCHWCKRFRAMHLPVPFPGNLPRDRTEGTRPFQTIGVDYAGPLVYWKTAKTEGKSYVLLYCCSLTRAVYIDLLPDLTFEEMIVSLKRFIARRGRPQKIYSDNASTFKAGSRWLKSIMKEEKMNDFLARNHIEWQFNLSRAPWWGGQYERIIGLVKDSLYKVIGRSTLRWKELESVLLDVEVTLNNRPLGYIEDELTPILTPNAMMMLDCNFIPEKEIEDEEEPDLRKRAKYLKKCKNQIWRRWTTEYVRSLREKHNLQHKTRELKLDVGDVVMIRGEEKNRAHWKTGIVTELFPGRDGIIRAAKLRAGKSYLERAVQHLYPLEISCETKPVTNSNLNPNCEEFRPKRKAAGMARDRIRDQLADQDEDLLHW